MLWRRAEVEASGHGGEGTGRNWFGLCLHCCFLSDVGNLTTCPNSLLRSWGNNIQCVEKQRGLKKIVRACIESIWHDAWRKLVTFDPLPWFLCWFSIAAVTNYRKLSGLKYTRFILPVLEVRSLKWIRMGQSQGVGRRDVLQDLFSCLVQFLVAARISRFEASFHLPRGAESFSCCITVALTFLPSSLTHQCPRDDISPAPITQDHLPSSRSAD